MMSMSTADWQRVKRVAAEAWAQPAADRAAFAERACAGDDALCREVLSLLESMIQAGERFETPALALPGGRRAVSDALHIEHSIPQGGRIGAWQIIRQLGHGGMGTVYLAERAGAEFRQQAALKIVRGGSADERLRRRFEDERRILATLDHPHIAHLIDGGTELGLPYVVMEYVEGKPFDVFCHEHSLDMRRRLEVFRMVCLAVHYAHQRLVVHRDLKASNILVTADGVPKLLDFGIAKILTADGPVEVTGTLFRVVTPESASPEQLRGEAITTSADVYALGVLLYRLLTGRSPYRVSLPSETELVRAICEEVPEPPSAVARDEKGLSSREAIPRDLDRVVLMALRKEPERRYTTAERLAEDVRLFLAGRPVEAGPDSASYRARKFVGRHRVAVGTAIGFMVALAGGIAVTSWQARVLRVERNRAQHQFNAVRSLAGSVLGELHDAVLPLPGSLAARELLVRRATEYLDALSADAEHNRGLRREVAMGYARLAHLQGQPGSPNLGDRVGAQRSFAKAMTLFESLDPASLDVDAAVALIDAYVGLAALDPDRALKSTYRAKAAAVVASWNRAAPSDPRVLSAEIALWSAEGNEQERAKDYAGARGSFTKAARPAEALLTVTNDAPWASRNLSIVYKKLGTENELLGDLDAAISFYKKALELDRARVDRQPGHQLWRLDLSFAHGALGSALARKEESARALEHYRQAVELRRAVVAADPNDDFAQSALARGHERLGQLLARFGYVLEALEAQRDRIEVLEKRRAARPERDNFWSEQTGAMMDASVRSLDLLERWNGPGRAAQARQVRAMLDRVVALQAQWARENRAGSLPPSAGDLEKALARCSRLIGVSSVR
jgi:non-specific serine/threonine protein kinase/serine/threonine-protein kinase